MARRTRSRGTPSAPPARTVAQSFVPFRVPRWLVATFLAVVALAGALLYVNSRAGDGAVKPLAVLDTADFHALAFSPVDPNVLFFGHHNGVMRSNDGGRTWRPLVARQNFDAMGLAVSEKNPQQLYLAGHDLFQASVDGGQTWQAVRHNLPGTDIHGFAMNPDDANRLYAFVVGRGVFASSDGGRAWQPLAGRLPGDVMTLAVGNNPEVLYAASMRSGVMVSADGGQGWKPASSLSGMVTALAADARNGATAYAGTETGLYKTTDRGATWSKLPFPGKNSVTVAVHPDRPDIVVAIALEGEKGAVYRSEDGGQTWNSRR